MLKLPSIFIGIGLLGLAVFYKNWWLAIASIPFFGLGLLFFGWDFGGKESDDCVQAKDKSSEDD
ncbi:hypothetical protein KCM76_19410 [Zooshikella marina]|uniref:hypothetical protein n=1 Tax=Zooshikella ganghwensis TaxID=202772 RepID=UPI001BAE7EDC|nr:hypothetical protein [Zooshikella ganghwensis]MBU2708169.1 hypothetical protein [Zooshikella ganghwensis]